MKYSASGRQPISVLRPVEEIKLEYSDRKRIYDFYVEFEEEPKEYVVRVPNDVEDLDWEEIQKMNQLCNGKFTLAVADLNGQAKKCKELGIKWYWAYPVSTYYELDGVVAMEPEYVLLAGSLYFDLPQVRKKGIPIRLVANMCYEDYIPRENGVRGTYVRPEDVPVYDKYVDVLEFIGDLNKEKALLGIYKEGKWPGNLDILLTNFGVFVDNRGIPEQFGEARVQCRQSCMRESHCRLCETIINFVNVVDKNNPKKH